MKIKQKGYLSEEEKKRLDLYLFKKELSYEAIATLLGVSRPSISLKFGGKRPISVEERDKIYKFLDEDSSLDFLVKDGLNIDRDTDKINDNWGKLFASYSDKLKELYENKKPELKGSILSDLEKLITKYSR